ncbi:MAG: long-chain-fatty-acid--CoA ligase [Crocinitomicaceae bacterium]|nr:long-chain-fatty-acid--CoA ligase [Crocinitomicaceae bacterium]|tara:strand:- start:8819 stop:10471 length:1653 start_codon:yes stop_codon:yes gene_type:complete
MSDFPWLKSYPDFVSPTTEINYQNIVEIYDQSIKNFGDNVAYKNMDVELTYKEIDKHVNALIWFFQNKTNLKKGDKVALQMPNLLQYPVAIFACLKAGLVIVNTNPLYTADEMLHQYKDSGAKAVIIVENFAFNLEKILSQTGIETVITTTIGDLLGGLKGSIVNFVIRKIKKMVPSYSLPGSISLKNILKENSGKKGTSVSINNDDTAFLQYTGGTTGVSKGAELTHGNICANVSQVESWIGKNISEGEEVIITALPLYHIFALTANCLTFFRYGSKNILITNPRDMPKFCADLKKNPFTAITGVNTLFIGLMNQEVFKNLDFSKMKLALGGGMAVQDIVAEQWEKLTGCPLLEAYGLSETSPAATINPWNGKHQIGSIGLPLPSTDIKILDDNMKEVKVGEPGEIAIKGPQVMKGYWNRPEETKKSMHGDYFLTGDVGTMDEKGFFKIVDRKKEMILVSGFNVYPNDVEKAISENPKVLEVGVRGEKKEDGTEFVRAFIVKKDPSLTEDEIINFCREKLTNYKVPKSISFREELPKSNVGKILRRLLE